MFCKVTIVMGIEMEHMHTKLNVKLPPLGKWLILCLETGVERCVIDQSWTQDRIW